MSTVQLYRLRLVREGSLEYATVSSPAEADRAFQQIAQELLGNLDREAFVVLALDARNRPIGGHVVSVGSLSASIVHPREVFKFAILANAAAVICAHNHPSGDPTPSQDDLELTRRLTQAGEVLGIPVLDALVTGHPNLLSFRERGLL